MSGAMDRPNDEAGVSDDERHFAERELTAEEMDGSTSEDTEKDLNVIEPQSRWDWTTDEQNPYNWPTRRKWAQIAMISSIAFVS